MKRLTALRLFAFMAPLLSTTTDFVMPYIQNNLGSNMTSVGYFGRGCIRPRRDPRYYFNRLVKRRKKNKLGKITKSIQRRTR